MAIEILAVGTDETSSNPQTLADGDSAMVWMKADGERLDQYDSVDIQFQNSDNTWTTQITLTIDRPNARFEGPVIWRGKRKSVYGSHAVGLQQGS